MQKTSLPISSSWWSLQFTEEKKTNDIFFCNKMSGRLRWNAWVPSTDLSYLLTSVPFVSRALPEYACLKIPVLLRTDAGSLLAFAEARRENCSDFASTDLVYRKSIDGGKTWSPLNVLADARDVSRGLCGHPLVVGNAAPVQLSAQNPHHPSRILVPHTHNNFEAWIVTSDDDGETWSAPRWIPNATVGRVDDVDCLRNLSYFDISTPGSYLEWLEGLVYESFDPYKKWAEKLQGPWQFVGLGPPGSLRVAGTDGNERVLVPGYHSWIRGLTSGPGNSGKGAGVGLPISQLYNNLAHGHLLVSEDGGDTFSLSLGLEMSSRRGVGFNEAQLVQLKNGSILANTRTLSCGSTQTRAQARSDDGGRSFTPTAFDYSVPEPFSGCEASIASSVDGETLWLTHPLSKAPDGLLPEIETRLLRGKVNLTGRDHMTLFRSDDQGATYRPMKLLDAGASGYSSVVADPTTPGVLWVLYEQSDVAAQTPSELGTEALIGSLTVLDPDRLVLRKVSLSARADFSETEIAGLA